MRVVIRERARGRYITPVRPADAARPSASGSIVNQHEQIERAVALIRDGYGAHIVHAWRPEFGVLETASDTLPEEPRRRIAEILRSDERPRRFVPELFELIETQRLLPLVLVWTSPQSMGTLPKPIPGSFEPLELGGDGQRVRQMVPGSAGGIGSRYWMQSFVSAALLVVVLIVWFGGWMVVWGDPLPSWYLPLNGFLLAVALGSVVAQLLAQQRIFLTPGGLWLRSRWQQVRGALGRWLSRDEFVVTISREMDEFEARLFGRNGRCAWRGRLSSDDLRVLLAAWTCPAASPTPESLEGLR